MNFNYIPRREDLKKKFFKKWNYSAVAGLLKGEGGILLPAKLRYIFEEKLLFSVNVIL